MKWSHPSLKDWQTWAIIGLMIVVAVLSRSYTETLKDVRGLQHGLSHEIDRNCNRDNYRISINTAAYIELAKAAQNREDVWRQMDLVIASGAIDDPGGKLSDLAAIQIGINHLEQQSMQQLVVAIANAEGDHSIDPYSTDLTIRAQQKC